MISPTTLQFLKQLKANNTKVWFDANRKRYDQAREEFIALSETIINELAKIDPLLAGVEAKSCLFRINRDVRFSKDKSPYKTNFAAYYAPGGKNSNYCGWYLHLEPGKSMMGGGLWQPEPAAMAKVRQEIDYNFKQFKKIIEKDSFKAAFPKIEGEQLKTTPKGYDATNAAIHYLKHKSWIVSHSFSDKDITSPDFCKNFIAHAKLIKPWLAFFNTALAD